MKMHLRGRLLIECSVVRGHLDGTDPEPSEDDDRDKKTIREWYLVDNRIMAIIGQSVVPSIRLQLGKSLHPPKRCGTFLVACMCSRVTLVSIN